MPHPRSDEIPKPWFEIVAAADGVTEVLIYDEISYWGVDAAEFARQLQAVDTKKITVRINSPGGNVYDGIAILNSLRSHDAAITTVVEGIAASAASFIAMAGDTVIMRPNAEIMIHNARGSGYGEAKDFEDMAARLTAINANIASIYAARGGGDLEDWLQMMDDETWFSADEAVEAGLADRVEASSKAPSKSKAKNSFDLSVFAHAGRANAPAPPLMRAHTSTTPSAVEAEDDRKERPMATLQEQLVKRLGIDAAADEDTIIAALDEALQEQVTEPKAPTLPEGAVAIEASVLEELRVNAALGAQARQNQEHAECVALVEAKVKSGAVTPARREHWLNALKADRVGAEALLATLADGLVPLDEIGHAGDGDSTPEDVTASDKYKNWK